MLSVNYIAQFLDCNQIVIEKYKYDKINDFEKKIVTNSTVLNKPKFTQVLPESFEILFNKNIENFYYDTKIYKNKSNIFTFFNSLLSIGNEYFNLLSEEDKEKEIKILIKKLDDDLFEKDLYNKFEYTKNRKFNKSMIQEVLKYAYFFKTNENFHLLKLYVADYLGINLFIFSVVSNNLDFNNIEQFNTKYYENRINKCNPTFLIIYENELYKPIMMNSNHGSLSVISYSEHRELVNNIFDYLKIDDKPEIIPVDKKYNNSELSKLKVEDIKKLCIENNIELQKKSDKTMKMINKLKSELLLDLCLIENIVIIA